MDRIWDLLEREPFCLELQKKNEGTQYLHTYDTADSWELAALVGQNEAIGVMGYYGFTTIDEKKERKCKTIF